MNAHKPMFTMEGDLIGWIRNGQYIGHEWHQIVELVREYFHMPMVEAEECNIVQLDERWGDLENLEILADERGNWIACFDWDVCQAYKASQQVMREAAE